MKLRLIAALGISFFAFSVPSLLAAPEKSVPAPSSAIRDITCYVVMEEGNSSEGNSLYLRKMGVDPEAVKTFAPVRFSRAERKFSTTVQGVFGYQAETPVLVDRSGRLGLYEVPLRLKADPPPVPAKTVTVTVLLSELATSGDIVQPAVNAMDKAAASQKMVAGTAWIIEMSYVGKGKLKAVVGLAK
jgi:hypothetical protein